MKVLVFDVPAEFGGVYTILKEFYHSVCLEQRNEWTFIVGNAPDIIERKMVSVERYEWIKKNWLYRLFFDLFYAPVIIRRIKPDVIVSFHNNGITGANVPQVLYMHQAMMFSGKQYTFKESKIYWFYQHVQSHSAFRYMRKNYTIVQTQWMKKAIVDKAKVNPEHIFVVSPDIGEYEPQLYQDSYENRHSFFYPVNYMPYKRHDIILDAVTTLDKKISDEFNVYFTVEVPILHRYPVTTINHVKNTGRLSREKVSKMYASSILVFPSELESFGLPLLEARLSGTIILVANTPFAKEILENYENAYFFEPGNSRELTRLMEKCISGDILYSIPNVKHNNDSKTGWGSIIDIITSVGMERK